jgi:phosphohistidine phosphatase
MTRLAVLRHAKSSWDQPGLDDFDRPLNDRGWQAARRMGLELKHRGLNFDLVLASSAARVRQTIEGMAEHFDFRAEIRFETEIYLADEGTLAALVAALPDSAKAALLVGHNPGLERLLLLLARDDKKGLRQSVQEKFPTAALAVVDFSSQHWADVAARTGEIVELILPRELD